MKKFLVYLVVCALFVPYISYADGAIVPPANYYAWETAQKAAIFYESKTETETMAVSMSFSGNAKDFAWLIPVPSQPTVEKGSQTLFTALDKLTANYNYAIYDVYSPQTSGLEEKGVSVIEQKAIDYYDVSVLSSTDSKALSKWLNDNGYQYPEKYAYIFNDYINNGWYFVAAKINPDFTNEDLIANKLAAGSATPLMLKFSAKNIIYPLKISQAVSANTAVPTGMYITLYVIADHRQDISGYTANYADSIKKDDLEELAFNTQGDSWVNAEKGKYFLTKFYQYKNFSDMNEDLFPKNAKKDSKISSGNSLTSKNKWALITLTLVFTAIALIVVVISPFALFFIIFSMIFYFTKNIKLKVTALLLQMIDIFITLCMLVISVVLSVFAFHKMFDALKASTYIEDEIYTVCALLACSIAFLVYFIAKLVAISIEKKKYKKLKEV